MLCPAKLREVAQWKKKIRQKFKNLGCTKNQANQNKHWTIRRDNRSVDPASHEDWWISYKCWQKVHVIGLYLPIFFVNVVCERPLNCTVFELDSKKMYLEGLLYFPIHHNTVYWLVFKMGSESERRCLSWTSKTESKTVTYTTVAILFTTFLLIIWFRTQLKF